eukprot:TRINITY_DN30711_c0_g1_i1.p1 TRINITY_DN30711_c0_g1~~TRINITY_DN30711_c0_g1_i1.p1  ORF type:complete len:527 (-),score=72.78 TRINITY_DN30711_c0_g1_i1:93-1673(-)
MLWAHGATCEVLALTPVHSRQDGNSLIAELPAGTLCSILDVSRDGYEAAARGRDQLPKHVKVCVAEPYLIGWVSPAAASGSVRVRLRADLARTSSPRLSLFETAAAPPLSRQRASLRGLATDQLSGADSRSTAFVIDLLLAQADMIWDLQRKTQEAAWLPACRRTTGISGLMEDLGAPATENHTVNRHSRATQFDFFRSSPAHTSVLARECSWTQDGSSDRQPVAVDGAPQGAEALSRTRRGMEMYAEANGLLEETLRCLALEVHDAEAELRGQDEVVEELSVQMSLVEDSVRDVARRREMQAEVEGRLHEEAVGPWASYDLHLEELECERQDFAVELKRFGDGSSEEFAGLRCGMRELKEEATALVNPLLSAQRDLEVLSELRQPSKHHKPFKPGAMSSVDLQPGPVPRPMVATAADEEDQGPAEFAGMLFDHFATSYEGVETMDPSKGRMGSGDFGRLLQVLRRRVGRDAMPEAQALEFAQFAFASFFGEGVLRVSRDTFVALCPDLLWYLEELEASFQASYAG